MLEYHWGIERSGNLMHRERAVLEDLRHTFSHDVRIKGPSLWRRGSLCATCLTAIACQYQLDGNTASATGWTILFVGGCVDATETTCSSLETPRTRNRLEQRQEW